MPIHANYLSCWFVCLMCFSWNSKYLIHALIIWLLNLTRSLIALKNFNEGSNWKASIAEVLQGLLSPSALETIQAAEIFHYFFSYKLICFQLRCSVNKVGQRWKCPQMEIDILSEGDIEAVTMLLLQLFLCISNQTQI